MSGEIEKEGSSKWVPHSQWRVEWVSDTCPCEDLHLGCLKPFQMPPKNLIVKNDIPDFFMGVFILLLLLSIYPQ